MKGRFIGLIFLVLLVLWFDSYVMSQEKQVLKKVEQRTTQQKDSLSIEWYKYDKGLIKASSNNKYIFLFFRTRFCKWCNTMEQKTFLDKEVIRRLDKSFVCIKVDIDSDDKTMELKGKRISDRDVAFMYNVFGYPYSVFLESDQKSIGVLPGYVPTSDFLLLLEYIGDSHHKKEKFEDFLKEKRQEAKKK